MTPIPRRPVNYYLERKVVEPLMLASMRIVLDPLRFLSSADSSLYKEIKELLFEHLEGFEFDEYWVVCDRSINKDPSRIYAEVKVRYNSGENIIVYNVQIRLQPQP